MYFLGLAVGSTSGGGEGGGGAYKLQFTGFINNTLRDDLQY